MYPLVAVRPRNPGRQTQSPAHPGLDHYFDFLTTSTVVCVLKAASTEFQLT